MKTEPDSRAMHTRLEASLLKIRAAHDNNDTNEELQTTDDLTPPAQDCAHHWIIETPQGKTSHGRCKCCGREKLFRNSGVTLSKEYTMEETGKRKLLYGSRDRSSIIDADNIISD